MESLGPAKVIVVTPRTRLKPRDKAILKFIASNGFVTSRAIADTFWKGNGNWNHYRRLRKLGRSGYLEPLVGDRGTRIGYRVTRKGLNHLRREGDEPHFAKGMANRYRTTLDHDAALLTIQGVLTKSSAVTDYLAEHEVCRTLTKRYGFEDRAGTRYKIPDALFTLKGPFRSFRVAVELEIAKKSDQRYRRFLKQHSLSPDWDIVLVISERDQTITKLKSMLHELRLKDDAVRGSKVRNAFYFIRLSDFLRDGVTGKFEGEGKSISIKQFEAL